MEAVRLAELHVRASVTPGPKGGRRQMIPGSSNNTAASLRTATGFTL